MYTQLPCTYSKCFREGGRGGGGGGGVPNGSMAREFLNENEGHILI